VSPRAQLVMPTPPQGGGILSDDARLTSICLTSVCRVNSRIERLRKTKIGTGVALVTYDSDTSFKVKRSKVNLQGVGRGHIVAASLTDYRQNLTVSSVAHGLPFHRIL